MRMRVLYICTKLGSRSVLYEVKYISSWIWVFIVAEFEHIIRNVKKKTAICLYRPQDRDLRATVSLIRRELREAAMFQIPKILKFLEVETAGIILQIKPIR